MNLPSSSVAGASSRKTVSRDPSSRDSSAAAPGRSFRNPLDAWLAGQCGVQDADANALARALRVAGKIEPVFVENIADVPQTILDVARAGDVVITMGAGSIGGVPGKLVQV